MYEWHHLLLYGPAFQEEGHWLKTSNSSRHMLPGLTDAARKWWCQPKHLPIWWNKWKAKRGGKQQEQEVVLSKPPSSSYSRLHLLPKWGQEITSFMRELVTKGSSGQLLFQSAHTHILLTDIRQGHAGLHWEKKPFRIDFTPRRVACSWRTQKRNEWISMSLAPKCCCLLT